jgi:hypothetical protein
MSIVNICQYKLKNMSKVSIFMSKVSIIMTKNKHNYVSAIHMSKGSIIMAICQWLTYVIISIIMSIVSMCHKSIVHIC